MPGNDLARQIKEHLTARQVVELYGFHPDRGGYIQCPFHTGTEIPVLGEVLNGTA